MTVKLQEFVWVSWRDKRGWHPKHVVPTRADLHPEECAGLMTLCGKYVPMKALSYRYSPQGPCRPHERAAPTLSEIMRYSAPESVACAYCRLRLTEERPDLYERPGATSSRQPDTEEPEPPQQQ